MTPVPRALLLIVAGGIGRAVCAQTATVTVAHDDPDGLVVPGQLVHLDVTVRCTDFLLFLRLDGGVFATPDVGIASNNMFGHSSPATTISTIIDPGFAVGGSVRDVRMQSGFTTIFGIPPAPPWINAGTTGLVLLRFDWTAPQALGSVQFDWSSAATALNPVFYVGSTSVPLPTTYVGTSLNVVPAPAASGLLAVGLGLTTARRRSRNPG